MSENFKKIKETLDILESGFLKIGLKNGKKILKAITPLISRIFEAGKIKKIKLPLQKDYLKIFKDYLKSGYLQGMYFADVQIEKKRSQGENAKFSLIEEGWDDWRPPREYVIPANAIKWVDKWAVTFGEEYYDELTDAFQKKLAESIASGEGIKGAMIRFEKLFEGQGFNQARLEVIARTNATTAFNQGHLEFIYENKDFVPAVQFMAILDDRVTDICESRNGKIIMTDDHDGIAENTPPLHYNCRSLLSPITKFEWQDIQDRGWDEKQNNLNNQTPRQAIDWSRTTAAAPGFGNLEKIAKHHSKLYDKDEVDNLVFNVSNKFEKEKIESNKHFKSKIRRIKEAHESFEITQMNIHMSHQEKFKKLKKQGKKDRNDFSEKVNEIIDRQDFLSQHKNLLGVQGGIFHVTSDEKFGLKILPKIDNHIQNKVIHRKIDDSGVGIKDLWSAKKINGELKKKANKDHFHPYYGGGSPQININEISHKKLKDIGINTHVQIDAHIAGDGSDHADVATNTANIATNTTAIGLNTTHRINEDAINGLVKCDGVGNYSAGVGDTDFQQPVTWGNGLTYAAPTASVDFNATNLKITSSKINTIQDIATVSSPTFADLGLSENLRLPRSKKIIFTGGADRAFIRSTENEFGGDYNGLVFAVAGGLEKLFIKSTGWMGLNESSPVSLFEISDTTANPVLTITNKSNTAYDPAIQFRVGATPVTAFRMGVDDSDSNKFKISGGSALGTNDRFGIDSTGKISINNADYDQTFNVRGSIFNYADGNFPTYSITAWSNTGWHAPFYLTRKYKGTKAVPLAVASGDGVGYFDFWGYDGTNVQRCAQMAVYVGGVVGAGVVPGKFKFNVTDAGGTLRNVIELRATSTIFNFDKVDRDFSIRGDNVTNLFYVDAGNDVIGIGTSIPSIHADMTFYTKGCICLKETTTPTADVNYGKIYCKADNKVYFQDGAGVEHEVAFV